MTSKILAWEKEKLKTMKKANLWLVGLPLGLAFYQIPAVGVAICAFSLIMFFTAMRSDRARFERLFSKGIKYYEKGHYSYAYVILNKAYEIERDNHELVKFLVLLNIALEKDPVETRILMDTLQSKWSSLYTDKDIEDLRNLACSVKPYS